MFETGVSKGIRKMYKNDTKTIQKAITISSFWIYTDYTAKLWLADGFLIKTSRVLTDLKNF